MTKKKEEALALISADELTLSGTNNLSEKQLALLLKRTPEKYVRQRPAKGGGTWDYVTGGYVKKVLNLMFGWDWDFEIIDQYILSGEAIVKGRLTCRSGGKQIIKMQFGNKDIVYKKETDKDGNRIPLSIGNDYKAAATDCLKKCAAEIGIAADIYNKEEFHEVSVQAVDYDWEGLSAKYIILKHTFTDTERNDIERILTAKEKNSYKKLLKRLSK